jgi:hypothetical protein
LNRVDFDNYVKVIFSLYKVKQNTIMKTCLFHKGHLHECKHLIQENYQPIFVVFLMFSVQYSVCQHIGLMHEQSISVLSMVL